MPAPTDTLRVPIAGGELHVRQAGDPSAADALVAIHGGPGLSHRYMGGLEALATGGRRVVSYDQRGCGGSQFDGDTEDDFSLDGHTADLAAVLDAVGAARAHLLGHSWGSVIAMHFAGTHPDRVASLLLIDACPPTIEQLAPGYERFSARIAELTERGFIPRDLPDDPAEQLAALAPVYFADPASPAVARAGPLLDLFPRTGELSAALLTTLDLTDTIAAYNGPVLVAIGSADPFGVEWAEATRAAFAHAPVTLEVFEACGHLPWIECPDSFYSVVEAFLAATVLAGPAA